MNRLEERPAGAPTVSCSGSRDRRAGGSKPFACTISGTLPRKSVLGTELSVEGLPSACKAGELKACVCT